PRRERRRDRRELSGGDPEVPGTAALANARGDGLAHRRDRAEARCHPLARLQPHPGARARAGAGAEQPMSVRRIDDVLAELDARLSRGQTGRGRVGYFAVLYREVTAAVKDAILAGEFVDGERLERLDVAFAVRYFDALEAYRRGGQVTESWKIAFD